MPTSATHEIQPSTAIGISSGYWPTPDRYVRLDAATPERITEACIIISLILNQRVRSPPRTPAWPGGTDRIQDLLSQPHLRVAGAVEVEARGLPVAVHDEHPFGTFALLREAQLLTALLGGCERAVEESDGPVQCAAVVKGGERCPPDALSHVLLGPALESPPGRRGAPYSRGRSYQRQPVVSTRRMPSMVRRSSARGHPVRAGGGRKERLKSHWPSVR